MNYQKWYDRFLEAHGNKPWALVTGGSSGMGLEYARQLSAIGCNLLLVSNQEEQLKQCAEDLKAQHPIEVETCFMDLAQNDSADELFAFCKEKSLSIDILVNNAGMFFFHELTPEIDAKAMTLFRLHTLTPTRLCLLFGDEMKQRGYGYMINMSSMASTFPVPGLTMYAATKAYLKSLSKSLYFEMKPYGVGVTTVCPGAIATPLYKLKEKWLNLGVKVGLIGTPQWLVKKAIKGMLHRRRVVKPGLMNIYLPPLIAILPHGLVDRIWGKVK